MAADAGVVARAVMPFVKSPDVLSPLISRDAGLPAFGGWNRHERDPQSLSYYTFFILLLSTKHFLHLILTCRFIVGYHHQRGAATDG
jgi:hypothetical protein